LAAAVGLVSAWAPAAAPVHSATPCGSSHPGEFTLQLQVGGLQRSALVHVPKLRTVKPMALVLAFHGAGGSGRSMARYSELSPFSDRNHFIVVYPSAAASAHRYWTLNANDPSKPDDVAFISALLTSLGRRVCMDPQRVYATGVSNGGGFTARLGCELSSRLAAIAPVAGGYRSLGPCRPDRPVSVLEIHGDSDKVVPYDGKPPDYAGSVPKFLGQWAQLDECPPAAGAPTFVARGAERFAWGPCAEEADIEHLKLAGVGHTWPGGDDSRGAPVSAAREVWLFFRGRRLAPARN
jgi:polyhydroxybutyrate depolymerase